MHSWNITSGGRPETYDITIRQRDRPSSLPPPESFHIPQGNSTIENLSKSKNVRMPTKITLKDGDQFLDRGLFYGNIIKNNIRSRTTFLKPLTLSKTDNRRWILAAPLITEGSDSMLEESMITSGRENN